MALRMMQNPSRRSFLGTLVALMPVATLATKQKNSSDPVLRFSTPNCDVEMSVKSYGKIKTDDLGFIDRVTNLRMCVPEPSSKSTSCVSGFQGALAVAIYKFSSQSPAKMPTKLHEKVLTIDHDTRIDPKPPLDGFVAVEKDVASDIQAFGYTPDRMTGMFPASPFVGPWCLMRQDLYLNEERAPFLILHWKHTLESIQLMDVIPGDGTRQINA
jgi:hypothetical protein